MAMDLQEIERAAAMGEPTPKGLSDLDWFYWRCMTDLYRRYNARTIDRDTARAEKRESSKDITRSQRRYRGTQRR